MLGESAKRSPREPMWDALLAQWEDIETRRQVLAFAKARCRLLQEMGIDSDPQGMVQDAIADTASGQLTWAPAQCSLKAHLILTIKNRGHKLRTRRIEHLNRGEPAEGEAASAENSLVGRDLWSRVREHLVNETNKAVGADNGDVMLVLLAFDDGVAKTAEICEETKLSPDRVKNAKLRIKRMLTTLPDDILMDARGRRV